MTPAQRAAAREALRTAADPLLAYFERRVQVREDAADLLGETMVQAWRRIDAMPTEDPERQRMWLYTVAAHVLANQRRTLRRRRALSERLRHEVAVAAPPPDDDERAAIRDAVLRLREAHRELIMLVHWDGFTLVQAADLLGLNPSTARTRYADARVALKTALIDAAAS